MSTVHPSKQNHNSSGNVISSPLSVAVELPFERSGKDDKEENSNESMETLVLPPVAPVTTSNSTNKAWTPLPASLQSQRTQNPIRAVVDPIMAMYHQKKDMTEKETKQFITLALGDPTTSGNFEPCPMVHDVDQDLWARTSGYVNALGTDTLRQAVAEYHSSTQSSANHVPARVIDSSHVIVASGCSGALDIALSSLLDPDSFLLVPNPGFPLYQVIAESKGAHVIPYDLLPHEEWQMDLAQIQTIVEHFQRNGKEIRGIVLNNPSNPTGSVYSLEHLHDFVSLCNSLHVPVVADEIYGDLTFLEDRPFIPLANVVAAAHSQVPVITCSGIGKQFLVPGWRVGWAVFHDNDMRSLVEVEKGAKRLSQVVLGASHPAQAMSVKVLKASLANESAMVDWRRSMRQKLQTNSQLLQEKLKDAPGLSASTAQGAMYLMVTFDPGNFSFLKTLNQDSNMISSAGEMWSTLLLQEENLFVLPGSCFGFPNAFRLVFCAPMETLAEAIQRIVEFSKRHYIGCETE